jgi:hypothetical protein
MQTDLSMLDDDFALAIHEAAHAVAHIAVNFPFDNVTIIPTDQYEGAVLVAPETPRPTLPLHVVTLLAGTIGADFGFGSHWVKRDSMHYGDWAWSRLLLKPTKPHDPLTAEERVNLDHLFERIGAGQIGKVLSMKFSIFEPAASKAVEVELSKLARATEKLLRRRWANVLAVADALTQRKTLTYPEVLAVLQAEKVKLC